MNKIRSRVKASQHESYGMFTLLCVLLAPVALIIGIIYLSKKDHLDRKLGEHIVALSILVMIVTGALWAIFMPRQVYLMPPTTNPGVAEPAIVAPSWDINTVYEKIIEGSTKGEVETITQQSLTNCGETSAAGVVYESCSYGGVSQGGIIVVNYVNGVVSTKSKATY